jgi:mono/diheme cytochrome c family protein
MSCRQAATRWVWALLAAAPLAALAGGQDKAPVFDKAYLSDPANIEAGRKVWEMQCRHCHGAAAYPGKAPKLRPGSLEPDFIFDRVTYGFGKMPSWKSVFSEEQRKAVVAFIKSDDFSP